MGHSGIALDGLGSEQEDLRNDRGLAQPADRGRHPYVYLDGIVLKRTWAGEVRNVSLLVAIGVNGEGYREISASAGAKGQAGWSGFLNISRTRPARRPAVIRTRAWGFLKCRRVLPRCRLARCVVHWYRNIFSHVPSSKVRDIAAMLRRSTPARTLRRLGRGCPVIEAARPAPDQAAELLDSGRWTLAYYTFPEDTGGDPHDNPLERILREIRRRTRVSARSRTATEQSRLHARPGLLRFARSVDENEIRRRSPSLMARRERGRATSVARMSEATSGLMAPGNYSRISLRSCGLLACGLPGCEVF